MPPAARRSRPRNEVPGNTAFRSGILQKCSSARCCRINPFRADQLVETARQVPDK
jgi:hypothetical protein